MVGEFTGVHKATYLGIDSERPTEKSHKNMDKPPDRGCVDNTVPGRTRGKQQASCICRGRVLRVLAGWKATSGNGEGFNNVLEGE